MLKTGRLLTAGLVAFLVGLVATLPAGHLAGWVADTLPEVRLGTVDGTLFSGRVKPVGFGTATFDHLDWRLRPLALLTGRVTADVTLATGASTATLSAARPLWSNRIELDGIAATVDLAWLTDLLPGPTTRLRGRLSVADLSLSLVDRWPIDASGQFTLHAAEQIAPFRLEVGGLTGQVAMEQQRLRIDFTAAADNPLDGRGSVLLAREGGYRVYAELRVRDGTDSAAAARLRLAGVPGPDGTVRVDRTGRLE